MKTTPAGQLAFDLDTLIHEVEVQHAPAWEGAPLHFSTGYYTPKELAEAFDRYVFEHGRFDCLRKSHMWHSAVTLGHANDTTEEHDLYIVSADLRCDHYRADCCCVGSLLYRAICVDCRWQHTGTEKTVVEAWHDHAWPGWRNLPVVPASIARTDDQNRPTKKFHAWITEHYPTSWQVPGAPIITERASHGTRHVNGRSPWKGFDLSHTALTD
jgi:hypothetical protein